MSTYAFRDAAGDVVLLASEFARPTPAHAQTPGALLAVEAVRAAGRAKRELGIVTDVGRPPWKPYASDPVTKAARDLVALGEAHGFEVELRALQDRCGVQGIRRSDRLAFRAYWVRGRTIGGSWHEPWRWTLAPDRRPVKIDAAKRVGLKGYRSAGMGETRLVCLGSPLGVPLNISELRQRIADTLPA